MIVRQSTLLFLGTLDLDTVKSEGQRGERRKEKAVTSFCLFVLALAHQRFCFKRFFFVVAYLINLI